MKIYVLVEVSYDHYRFQENIFASADREKCGDMARELNEQKKFKLPIFDYSISSEYKIQLDKKEQGHYWIQCIDDENN